MMGRCIRCGRETETEYGERDGKVIYMCVPCQWKTYAERVKNGR